MPESNEIAYQALYRALRPETFSDMVGQKAIVRTLQNQIISEHVAHAYLFCGSRGTGKTSAAKIMARAVNCPNTNNGDPCLTCPSCVTIGNNASLDVVEMDAASNSRVEEIRDLLEKVAYPPQFGKKKVYIIDEVHMLSTSAFNALLKTLEEPPTYMVFILATTEPQKIPATILSRCQRFDFTRFTEPEMVGRMQHATLSLSQRLNKPLAVAQDAYELIAQEAQGGMRDALSLLDMCLSSGENVTLDTVRDILGATSKEFLFSFVQAILDYNVRDVLHNTADLHYKGYDIQVFFKDLNRHVRRLLQAKYIREENPTGDEKRYQAQADPISDTRLLHILDLILKAQADTRYAINERTVLEVCVVRSAQKEYGQGDVQALLDRVNDLEKQLTKLKEEGALQPPQKAQAKAPVQPQKKPASPPSSPAPVAPIAGGKNPAEIWKVARQTIIKRELRYPVGMGKLRVTKEGVFQLVFAKEDDIYVNLLNSKERRETVEEILKEVSGTKIRFEACVVEATADLAQAEIANRSLLELSDAVGRENIIVRND